MNILEILPQPLGIEPCPFHDEVKALVKKEIALNMMVGEDNPNNDGELIHIDDYSVLDKPEFHKFRTWIEEQCAIFLEHVMGEYVQDGVIVTDSWINICDKGGFAAPHYHTNSYVTALYYVNFNENHTPTYFAKTTGVQIYPNTPNLTLPQTNNTRFNQLDQVMPSEGDLFMWPSTIIHGFKTNNEDNRITLAVNVMPKLMTNGDYGWKIERLTDDDRSQVLDKRRTNRIWSMPDLE